jgi:type I restriction enzyme S subunit
LIANNERRIELLEEAMHLLYREWFVHLRFPGWEETEIVDGVPEGWEKRPLGKVAKVNSKSIKKSNAPEQINYIDISSVGTGILNNISPLYFADAPSRARRIVKHGDVIWSCVRPNRKAYSIILEPEPNTIVSTGFAVLTALKVPFSYLYLAVTTPEFVGYLTKVARGAAYPAVSASDFENADIYLPDRKLLQELDDLVLPMLQQKRTLWLLNLKLREARDALLPRLMSGRIEV